MRIDVNSSANLLPADWNSSQGTKGASNGVAQTTQDTTTFSHASTMVQSLTAQAMNTPAVRQAKVDALHQSVSSGNYSLDPAGIAAAMVSSGAR